MPLVARSRNFGLAEIEFVGADKNIFAKRALLTCFSGLPETEYLQLHS
jgi:hypothetical protein